MHRIREALELLAAGTPADEMLRRMNLSTSKLKRILNSKRFGEELQRIVLGRLGRSLAACPESARPAGNPEDCHASPDADATCPIGVQRDTAGHSGTARRSPGRGCTPAGLHKQLWERYLSSSPRRVHRRRSPLARSSL